MGAELESEPVEVSGVLRLRSGDAPPAGPGGLPAHGVVDEAYVLEDARWERAGG